MAKKRINRDDVAPKGIFDNVTEGAREAKAQVELLTQAVKLLQASAQKTKSGIQGAGMGDTKGMKEFDAQAKKANQTAEAKLNIDKKLLVEKAKLQQLTAQQNKQIKTTVQATQRLTAEQQRGLGTLQKLEIHNTKLRATRAKLNLETQRGQRILKQINAQLDINNNKIKQSGDAMKKQRMNVGNYGSAISKLRGAMAQLGLAFGVFTMIRNSFNVIKNFEQSQADLASVLGVNTSEMKGLTEQAKNLGATTTFTASQVAELQKELAKLGFSQSEIEGMTESTLLLAEATGTELARAAEVTGATMRGFGLEAHDTQRVVDVMAKSFSSSSLDMEKFATAMGSVAPVAKLAGYTIEETTALIGTMTDRGIDASTAGTGLRNMFLLAGKAGLTLDQALEQINNSSDKTGESFKLFGTRGATLGVVLAENRASTETLTEKLERADGAAKKMAETQRDTLGGAIALLQSAWEGLILKMDEAGGIGDMLKEGIKFLAENLETIVSVIKTAIQIFVSYKTVVLSSALANKVMASSFVQIVRSGKGVSGIMKGIQGSFAKLGQALKANIFGIIILALYKLYEAFNVVKTAGEKMGEIQDKLNDSHADAQVQLAKEKDELDSLVGSIKDTTAGTLEREEAIGKLNERYGVNLKNIKDEKKFLAELDLVQKKILKNIENKIRLMEVEQEFAILGEELVRTEIEQGKLRQEMANAWGQNAFTEFLQGFGDYENTKGVLQDQFKENEKLLKQLKKKKEAARKELAKQMELVAESQKQEKKVVTGDDIDEEDDGTGTVGKVAKLKDLNRQIRDEQIKQIQDKETRDIEARKEETKRAIEDVKATVALKSKKAELIKELEETLQIDLMEIEKSYQDAYNKSQEEFLANQRAIADKIAEDKKAREEKAKQEALDSAQSELDMINKMFEDALKQKELALLQSNKTQEEIDAEMLDFQIEQLEKQIAVYKSMYAQNPELYQGMNDAILDMEIDLANKKRTILKGETDDFKDEMSERIKLAQEATDLITDAFTNSIDKRIEKLDEEMEAHKSRADELAEMAKNGNIQAQESLAEENRLIAEAEAEKAEQEKRKQRVLLVSAFIKAYLSGLDSGDEPAEALTKALTSSALLDQVVANIGSFFDGTEDTGKVGKPLDSNGGRLALLHNNERVMTAKQNKMIGNVSNEEVARVMENKRLGKLVDGNQIAVGWENIMLLDQLNSVGQKLDKVNKTIEDKPETNIELGAITQKTMEIIETKKRGRIKTVSTFKVTPQ